MDLIKYDSGEMEIVNKDGSVVLNSRTIPNVTYEQMKEINYQLTLYHSPIPRYSQTSREPYSGFYSRLRKW